MIHLEVLPACLLVRLRLGGRSPGELERANYEFNLLTISWGLPLEQPKVDPDRHGFLGYIGWRVMRLVQPIRKFVGAVVVVTVEALESHASGIPSEPLRGEFALQLHGESLASAAERLTRRPDGVVAHRSLCLAPLSELDVYLVGAIRSDIGGRVVEQSEHNVRVESIHASDHPELVAAKAEPILRQHLRAIPSVALLGEFQVQVAALVNPDVILIPVVRTWAFVVPDFTTQS